MGLMNVMSLLAELEASDIAVSSADELAAVVATAGRLRAWLDAFDVRVAVRAAELAAAGSGTPAAETLADHGRRGSREAAGAVARAEVCATMPAFEHALAAARCRPVMSTRSPAPARSLPESSRADLAALQESLVASATARSVEAFERDCPRPHVLAVARRG